MAIGMDIGNKYAYMSVLAGNRGMVDLVNENPRIGLPTDAIVQPNGPTYINKGLSYSGARPAPNARAMLHSVKTMLNADTLECETARGEAFAVHPVEVYTAIVKEMLTVALQQCDSEGVERSHDVVIALPAQFYDGPHSAEIQQKVRTAVESITIDSKPVRLMDTIPEPAAAAIDYLFYCRNEIPEEKRVTKDRYTVAVYDLGHGTFDTALVEVDASNGIRYRLHHQLGLGFGGKDMDQRILDIFASQAVKALGDMNAAKRIRKSDHFLRRAQEAKEMLSEMDEYEFDDIVSTPVTFRITREVFETAINMEIDQTLQQLQIMLDHAQQLGLTVDMIVLSGGCCYIPLVRAKAEAFARERGIPCCTSTRPGKSVAYGAARYAAAIDSLTRYTGYNYYLLTDQKGKTFLPAVPKRSQLPFTSPQLVANGGDEGAVWVVRSLDENDPNDANSLEAFKRIYRFCPENDVGNIFRLRIGEDYLISIIPAEESAE